MILNDWTDNHSHKTTIIFNDKLSGKLANKYVSESIEADTEDDSNEIDDGMNSDKDKYSTWYGSGRNYYDFNNFPDTRKTLKKKNSQFELEIEGPSSSINWWCGEFSTPAYDENSNIFDKAIYYSIQIGNYAAQGYNMLFGSSEVSTLKSDTQSIILKDKKKNNSNSNDNHTFSNENTFSTLPHSRKQSFVSRVNIHRKFYEN